MTSLICFYLGELDKVDFFPVFDAWRKNELGEGLGEAEQIPLDQVRLDVVVKTRNLKHLCFQGSYIFSIKL